MTDARTAPEAGSALQLKARLLGISPMIWRRVLVPETISLHELHGVLQVAMGWEGVHLFQFSIRGVVHAGPHLCGQKMDLPLSDFRFRRNAKFSYVYDMRRRWEHELRVENRVSVASTKRHPLCIGGSGACPPEECGGPDDCHARREEAVSLDAMMDLGRVAGFIERIVIQRDLSGLEDEDERWHAGAWEPNGQKRHVITGTWDSRFPLMFGSHYMRCRLLDKRGRFNLANSTGR